MRRPCASKRRSRTCRHCVRITPLTQSTVCGPTSRKMRVGWPYRLCGVRSPLKARLCRSVAVRRSVGVVPPLNSASRPSASRSASALSACISAGSQAFIVAAMRPTSSCPCGRELPAAVHRVATALHVEPVVLEAQHEGMVRHQQRGIRLAAGIGGRLQRPAVVLQRARQGRCRSRALRRGRLQRQHAVGGVPARRAAVLVELQQPAFADAELLAVAGGIERDGVALGVPAEAAAHRLRRRLAVLVARAQGVAAVVLQRQPHLDAGAVGAGRDAAVGAGPVERIAAVVAIGGAGRAGAVAAARHAAGQRRRGGEEQQPALHDGLIAATGCCCR